MLIFSVFFFLFPTAGFNLIPLFPSPMGEFPQGAAAQVSPDHHRQQLDANTSMKTEYMSFPPPLQRSPLNAATERGYARRSCAQSYLHLLTRAER